MTHPSHPLEQREVEFTDGRQASRAVLSLSAAYGCLFFSGQLAGLMGFSASPVRWLSICLLSMFVSAGWLRHSTNTSILPFCRILAWFLLVFVAPLLMWGSFSKNTGHLFFDEFAFLLGLLLAPELIFASRSLNQFWKTGYGFNARAGFWGWGFLLAIAPFALKPYYGALGASLLLSLFWGWLLTPLTFVPGPLLVSLAKRGWPALLPGGLLLLILFPAPQTLSQQEVLYTSRLPGISSTVHARRQGAKVYYSVTIPGAVLYQDVQANRYAELMVHPAIALSPRTPQRVLLIGGENGHLLRELAKYNPRLSLKWLDLFPQWTHFFFHAPIFREQNSAVGVRFLRRREILPPTLEVGDLLRRIKEGTGSYDLILADFPKPHSSNRALFDPRVSRALLGSLGEKGVMMAHLGSPYTQGPMFWCLVGQWARIGAQVVPLQLAPALFQDFGFVLISKRNLHPFSKPLHIGVPTSFLYAKQPLHVFARFSKETKPDGRDMSPKCFQKHLSLISD